MFYNEKMKFILDMGIPPKVGHWLVEVGHEAIHIGEVNPRALDTEILEWAQEKNAIILTADKDFSDLLATRGLSSPSVILFRLTPAPPGQVIQRLEPVLKLYTEELEKGCLVTIAIGKARLRRLPIHT